MKIEIWSDIACPWCYIGRRRLEHALEQFDHADQVEVIWRSFQLDPTAPREYKGSINDMLAETKGIDRGRAEAMHAHVTALAAQEGLDYRFDRVRPGNSFDAHRLLHLAAQHGLQSEMKERLQKAYFTDGLSFSDPDTLVQLASEIGLDADEARQALTTDAYAAAVRADIRRAQMLGIHGVPFFLFDEKYAVSGAQPTELFLTALERTWGESHPLIEVMGVETDEGVCDDENCVI
ncbi:MAG TPA: DsbA family oxidoreductase [Phototrophicaceae bacterium]|nr:DsbA family oxidoreductase [Phototrophicaceae bacterium]